MTRRTRAARARLLRLTGPSGGIAGSVFGAATPRESRRLGIAALVALTAYAVVGTWAARAPRPWLPNVLRAPQMTVELLRPPPPPLVPAGPAHLPEAAPKRHTPAERPSLTAPSHTAVVPRAALQPLPRAPAEATPSEEAAPAPSLVAVAPADATTSPVTAPAGGNPSALAAGTSGASANAAPISEASRTSMIGRYRTLMRGRIQERFRYPPEARDLELAGEVVVQLTVDRSGHLVNARISGACPHALLCDDALRTIRAAAPFTRIPEDLGEKLQVEVPLNYSFE